jgi:hypothetical protein
MKVNNIRFFPAICMGLLLTACSGPPIQMYKMADETAPSATVIIEPKFIGRRDSAGVSRYEWDCDSQGKVLKQHVTDLVRFKSNDPYAQKTEARLPVGEANLNIWFSEGDAMCSVTFLAELEKNHVYGLSSLIEKKGFFSFARCRLNFNDLTTGVAVPVITYGRNEPVGESVCKRHLKNNAD